MTDKTDTPNPGFLEPWSPYGQGQSGSVMDNNTGQMETYTISPGYSAGLVPPTSTIMTNGNCPSCPVPTPTQP